MKKGKGYSSIFSFFEEVEVGIVGSTLKVRMGMILGVLEIKGQRDKVGVFLGGGFVGSMRTALLWAGRSFEILVPANISR
jgi:hypothetical protein